MYLDERVRALALLQLSQCEEDDVKSLLSRTEFRVEVWSIDHPSGGEHGGGEPSRDLVYSALVDNIDDPIILAQQSGDDAAAPTLILAWELSLVLPRPRIRMQDPSIFLRSIVAVSAAKSELNGHENYLVPFKPLERNVLEPMRNMPGLGTKTPYLAASRLERVRPATPKDHKQFRAEHMSPRHRIASAVITRMRYTRMSTPSSSPTVIASLDIEVNPMIELQGTVEKSEVTMLSGKVEDLMPEALPMECQSRDWISLLFRLYPGRIPAPTVSPITPGAGSNMDVLSISLLIKVQLSGSSQSHIHMTWTTNVDFFQALNPSFGAPSQPIQRTNRPSSLALGNGNGRASQSMSVSLQPVLPHVGASEVTISFTAPEASVEIGKRFVWSVLVINNSAKPTKLAIIPLPRIPRGTSQSVQFGKRHAPKSSTASFQPAERRHARENESDVDFAQAVVDENVVYAMQHSNAAPAGTDLMALTAEVRIGPLAPGQCHESSIEMVAFTAGTLRVDAVRVIDLMREVEEGVGAAGVMLDIRDLPDVVVVAPKDSP